MNQKQLTLLLVLGVVIGGLGLYLTHRERAKFGESGQGLGGKLMPDFPMNDVAHIVIREDTNDLHLAKEEGVWKVQERYGYPADYADVSGLLRKIWELKVVQSEQVGASQWSRLQLAELGQGTNSGTRVEFKDSSGKELGTIVLGKKHMHEGSGSSQLGNEGWPDGRYLRVAGSERVSLVSDAFSEIESNPERFLSKEFIKVEKPKTVSVTHTEPTNSWALTRETETGPWTLVDPAEGEKVDASKTSSMNYVLSNPSFDDVVSPNASAELTGLDKPQLARVDTFEGFHYTLKIGNKTPEDKYYLNVQVEGDFPRERTPVADEKKEDQERLDREFKEKLTKLEEKLAREKSSARWTYLVSKWTVDPLLKARSDFLESKTPPPAEEKAPAETEEKTESGDDGALVPELFK